MDRPRPQFRDVTNEFNRFRIMREEFRLGDIRKVCDDFCFSIVLCLWGCFIFFDEVGILNLVFVFY